MSAVAYAISPELVVVAPPGVKLNRAAWDEVEFALELEDLGDLNTARDLLRRLEARLGVTDFDRVEAATPRGAVRGPYLPIEGSQERRTRLAAALAAKPAKRRQKALADLNLLTLEMQRAWDKAERKIRNAKSKQERDIALAARIKLERDWRDRSDSLRRDEQIAETVRLERGRGATDKDFEVSQKAETFGRVRIRTRDGLEIQRPKLSRNQYAGAEQYRDDYERGDPERGLKSAMGESAAVSPPDNPLRDPEALARVQRRAWRGERLRRMDKLVFQAVGPMGVTVLHEVVGKARMIEHITTSRGMKDRYAAALIEALDLIADHLGLQ